MERETSREGQKEQSGGKKDEIGVNKKYNER